MDIPYDRSFIAGRWLGNHALDRLRVCNPADQKLIKELSVVDAGLIQMAIDEAVKTQAEWQAVPAKERRRILLAWHDRIVSNRDMLTTLLAMEGGKPIRQAQAEVEYALGFVEWSADQAVRVYGETYHCQDSAQRALTIKQPIGVVAAITPWNFPAAMVTRKVAPALAAGCAVILKPSEETPLTALMLAALAKDAGLPDGVFNVLVGSADEIGHELCAHPSIRALSFTGSTEVGRLLLSQCAGTVKRCVMELGGNAPFVVCQDADIEKAVEGLVASRFRHSGQTCICANRVFVHQEVLTDFVDSLKVAVERLTLGGTLDQETDIGPLITAEAVQRVNTWVQEAEQQGAACILGGGVSEQESGGHYYKPAILTGVSPSMTIASHEIFGPVVAIQCYESEEDMIRLVNDTEHGLAGYLYTSSIERANRLSEAMQVGMVGVNTVAISSPMLPFGGVKQSGIGREGAQYGVEEYLETKTILLS